MIKWIDGEPYAFCDRCSAELPDKLVVLNAGDCLCENCFNNEHKIMTAEEYLEPYRKMFKRNKY